MPEDIPIDTEIFEHLESLHRRVRRAARRELEPLDLTPGLARALRTIAHAECAVRMRDLADRLRIARRSATSVVDELDELGLVRRCRVDGDRRAVTVELTAAGRSMLKALRRNRDAAASDLLSTLGPSELEVFRDLLRRVDRDPEQDRASGRDTNAGTEPHLPTVRAQRADSAR